MPPDPDAVEAALRDLQARFPTAPLIAVTPTGLVVNMPGSVPRRENPVLRGRSALDGVPIEDREQLIAAFDEVLRAGTGQCTLHPPGYGEVIWHGFDLRARHGVIVGMLATDQVPAPDSAEAPERDMARVGPPRFATMHKDERGVIVGVSGAMTEILGWTVAEMVGRRSLEFVHSDDHALAVDNWMEMLAQAGPSRRIRQRLRHKSGAWVWFEVTNTNLLASPDHRCVVGELVDISDEMAAQEALREREQLLRRLAETIPVGLVQIDAAGTIVYTNDRLHEILGVPRCAHVDEQLATVVPDDRAALHRSLEGVLEAGADSEIEVACRRSGDEELRFCTISFRALRHDDGTVSGAIACVVDVTDSARMREELTFRATFDGLTGCHNRASIMAALEAEVASDRRGAERAVMFLDLDGFKSINDRYGHAEGDALLRQVATRLRGCLRERDLVGRMGGDEFLVVCPDVGGAEGAARVARRVARSLHEGMNDPRRELPWSVSIGVAWSSATALTPDALVAAADAAMYDAKRAGRGELRLAADLHTALEPD